ncbi:glutamine amidotransferase [Sulfitobacter sp. S223]|uniref:glutamine amidotransferase n=1 Tax=Sulfitobacter sp. S223 TaxID=2867023 RepID=UPI0021A5ABCA|nr:glutamine amidotransferase [Sulfitobacter sp. S223]UWR26223.1 glutamine amidotransferase [Sulfitobacter sp. S223]
MTSTIVFDPLVPWPLLMMVAVIATIGVMLALVRGLRGWALRGLAGLVLLAALSGPSFQQEDRAPLSDIVLMLEDESASQRLGDRSEQTGSAADTLAAQIEARPNTELRRITVADGQGDVGTELMNSLSEALAEEPRARVAGIVALTDGRVHDADLPVDLPAPFHVLLSGEETDWDRRLSVVGAPAFAIIGEPVVLTLRIDDLGAAPAGAEFADLDISIDGDEPQSFRVPIGQDLELPVTLPHGGRNVIRFSLPDAEGELTDRNNSALIQINGVRDRLRVLLVSGEPHAGGRTWRNLLKSDSSVDLVHFTILRPPEKQDGVPVSELSLIAFPTRELFMEKIEDFDLIIFDRYKRRGILPGLYLENIANYVRNGGAVLVSAGPDFASADSLFRTPLGTVLPANPSARVLEEPYLPLVSDLGNRHPVTTGLPQNGDWGRWLRQIDVTATSGNVVMTGIDDRPLLILDRVEKGRVALLASDHAWLWNRGYEGGGPQLELLRRLAHWMMGEPELEEEALTASAEGQTMRIERRTLTEDVPPLTITGPDGTVTEMPFSPAAPGRFEAMFTGPEIGLYRLENGDQVSVIGLGPAAPREFVETIANADVLEPTVGALRGGIIRLEEGLPSIRNVRAGRPAAGRGWIGFTPRAAYETRDVRQTPILPAWLVLLLAASLITAAWLREGRS